MEKERDAKEYSWKWLTASELLSYTACDLTYVLVTSKTSACSITLYDGADTTGRVIATIESLANRSFEFSPCNPIYCRRGLYYSNVGQNVLGTLIQWRPRAPQEG